MAVVRANSCSSDLPSSLGTPHATGASVKKRKKERKKKKEKKKKQNKKYTSSIFYNPKAKEKDWFHGHSPLFFFFFFLRASPMAYGGSQTRGPIGAVAFGLRHSHAISEPRLQPPPQLTAMPDP